MMSRDRMPPKPPARIGDIYQLTVTLDENACNIDIDGPHPRQRFDARARADLDALLRESEQHGPRLQHAFVNFAPDGTVTRDSWLGFSFGTSYVYDPGAAAKVTTTDDSTCQEPVDDDWYRDWICF